MKHRAKLSLLALAVLLIRPAVALAAEHSPSGITVSPAFQQVTLNNGQIEQPVIFSITNNEAKAQTLSLTTQDFNTLDETGGLFFVGSNPTELQKKYGLSKWLILPQSTLTIQPKQTAQINARVIDITTMPAGGHYGALLLSLAGAQPGKAGSVAVHPIASSLLFVSKLGGDTHFLKLANVYLSRRLFGLPSSVTLRFYNDGNTHLIPRGVVTITSPSGNKTISKAVVNENSGIILPQTYRRYIVPLNTESHSLLPGHYKLNVNYRFDGFEQYRQYQISFWVLPIGGLLILTGFGILLLGIVFRAVRYIKIRRHKRRAHRTPNSPNK